jgi:hypothetical protein
LGCYVELVCGTESMMIWWCSTSVFLFPSFPCNRFSLLCNLTLHFQLCGGDSGCSCPRCRGDKSHLRSRDTRRFHRWIPSRPMCSFCVSRTGGWKTIQSWIRTFRPDATRDRAVARISPLPNSHFCVFLNFETRTWDTVSREICKSAPVHSGSCGGRDGDRRIFVHYGA